MHQNFFYQLIMIKNGHLQRKQPQALALQELHITITLVDQVS